NDKFNNLEENNDSHKKLLEDAQRITHLKNVVKQLEELGKNKDKLLDYDNYLDKKEQLIKNKETLSKEQNILAEKIQEEILTQNDNINDIRQELARYNYFYENIEFFYQAEKDIALYSEKLKSIEDTKGAIVQLEKEVSDYNANLEEYEEELNILENSIGKLKLDILKKETEVEKLEDFRNLENTIKSKAADLKEKQTELSLANSRQKELEQKILELEKNKQQEILNTFLVHLHEGDCCPLCQQKIEKLPAVKQVIKTENEDAKNELDDIIKNIIRLETLVVKEKEDLSILQEELTSKKIEINFSAKEELEQFVVEKKNEDNKRKITFEKIEKVSNCRNELAEKLEELNSLISFESEYKEKLGIAQAKQQQYTENIDISLDEFKQYYEKQKQIVLSYDEKQELYQKIKTNLMLKEKELINSNKNILEVEKTIENIIEKFEDSKLKLYYNSLKIAKDDLVKLDDVESYKNEIQVYEDRLKIILDNIQRLEEELHNKERPNLEDYEQKLLKKEQKMMNCAEDVAILKTKFKSNTNLFESLSKEFTILEKNISTAREVFTLSNVISGKTESKKSLETYVQGYYLDLILEAGTKRLLHMTDERYRFERKIEKAKGGGLQGLDIEIYDVYLNSSRVVSSLSGGEIFLASLALALGLAEVIQNESGGISLETIFIDEGFGSLDAETLDTAITTLIELQSYGRNIGIISHVSELKERIRPKLEVYSKNNYAKVKISGV
ncbi:SbcC/MukB-like Walker B domain-containing protein, partial [Gemella morbillorum]|uniref:SbcC/MukB-like Walker B domain-containing protein n=1 Tax=Gemella morbillorum TaxID=29391 RepID=UPI0023EFEF24